MFEKSIKEELLKMKESITTKYISFFNDGTTSIENGEYVNSSTNDCVNSCCSGIDHFLQIGTKSALKISEDFDQLDFLFRIGIIYDKKNLGENNEILPTSMCLTDKARYYTDAVRIYKDSKLIKKISTSEMSIGRQGFVNYDEFIKSAKKEKIQVNGPKSFEDLKELILSNKTEEIFLSISFKNDKDITEENLVAPNNNEIIQEDNTKRKTRSLFRK